MTEERKETFEEEINQSERIDADEELSFFRHVSNSYQKNTAEYHSARK